MWQNRRCPPVAAIFQPLSSRGSTTNTGGSSAACLRTLTTNGHFFLLSISITTRPNTTHNHQGVIKYSLPVCYKREVLNYPHRLCNTFPCHFHFLFLPRTKTKLNRLHRNRQVVMQYFRLLCDAPLLLLVCLHSIARFRDQTLTFFSVFPPRFVQMIIHAYD